MRSLWKLLFVLPLLMTPCFVGCGGNMSQDSAEELADQVDAEDEAAGENDDADLDEE